MKLGLAVGLVIALGLAESSAYACKHAHTTPFQAYDEAATVAIGTVTTLPEAHKAGQATLGVTAIVKGARAASVVIEISDTDCGVRLKQGAEILVFLNAQGWPVSADDGVLRDVKTWKPVIEAWGAAKGDAGRASALVDAIGNASPDVSKEAAGFLVEEPALLAALTADGRAKIGKATVAKDDWGLPWLLVRLHDASAAKKVPSWATLAKDVAAVTAFESETDTGKLADAIGRGSKASRFAAFERCERVQGKRLAHFSRWIEDVDPKPDYAAMATSCRAGTAMK